MINYTGDQALANLFEQLADGIQSPEAVAIEAQFRLEKLERLIQTGVWIQDDNFNIFPTDLPDADKDAITENCSYSIIDGTPEIKSKYPAEVTLEAVGSLVSGLSVVIESPLLLNLKFGVKESTIIDSEFTF